MLLIVYIMISNILDTREISTHQKKKEGVFYTYDLTIIDKILDLSIRNWDFILDLKIFEPACGNGAFLVRLLQRIYEQHKLNDEIVEFVQNNLFFNDVSSSAIDDTCENIRIFFNDIGISSSSITFNAFNIDFTRKQNNIDLFSNHIKGSISDFYRFFDVVLGNPPYVSLYGRRDKKKDESLRDYYLKTYNLFPQKLKNGKINFVMLFIEHGINFLKNDGILTYIIDVSFFESAYEHLRKYILEHTKIEYIITEIKSFDVASGQIIISLKKRKNIDFNYNVIIENNYSNTSINYNICSWYDKSNEYKFEIIGQEEKLIIKKIYSINKNNFSTLFPKKTVRTCCMMLNMEDRFTSLTYDKEEYLYKYYEGSKSLKNKYSKMVEQKYFFYNKGLQNKINDELKIELEKQGIKNKKRIGLGEIDLYDNPKIFIRQSAKEIIATYDDFQSAANNSLYSVSFRNSDEKSVFLLKLLLAQLNSTLITFFAQSKRVIRYSKGKQPQIKISDINQIPIFIDTEIDNQLVSHIDSIIARENVESATKTIDEMIFNYYMITDSEKQFIFNYVKKYKLS